MKNEKRFITADLTNIKNSEQLDEMETFTKTIYQIDTERTSYRKYEQFSVLKIMNL